MFVEGLDALPALSVPHSHCLVVTTRHDEATILAELCTPNPVTVPTQSELKLLSIYSPDLRGEGQTMG